MFVALWVAIGGGMLTLLIAAIGKAKKRSLQGLCDQNKRTQKNFLWMRKTMVKLLEFTAKGKIKGQKKSSLNLLKIEQLLKNNVWIKDAELYFDNQDVLHVSVTEREPIARIFTITGQIILY